MAAEEDRGSYNIEGREDALEVNEDAFFLWETAAGTSLEKKTHVMTVGLYPLFEHAESSLAPLFLSDNHHFDAGLCPCRSQRM